MAEGGESPRRKKGKSSGKNSKKKFQIPDAAETPENHRQMSHEDDNSNRRFGDNVVNGLLTGNLNRKSTANGITADPSNGNMAVQWDGKNLHHTHGLKYTVDETTTRLLHHHDAKVQPDDMEDDVVVEEDEEEEEDEEVEEAEEEDDVLSATSAFLSLIASERDTGIHIKVVKSPKSVRNLVITCLFY